MSITWASVFPLHNDKTCSVYRVDKSQRWEVFSLRKEVKKKSIINVYFACHCEHVKCVWGNHSGPFLQGAGVSFPTLLSEASGGLSGSISHHPGSGSCVLLMPSALTLRDT